MLIFKISNMKKYVLIVSAVMLLALASAVCSVEFDDSQIRGLNVTTDVDGAMKASQAENKTLMMVFDQDNCVYCVMFKSDVLSNGDVQRQLDEKCIVLLVDTVSHPDVANKYKVFGTPVTIFLDSNGKEIAKVEGYVASDEFLNTLKGI